MKTKPAQVAMLPTEDKTILKKFYMVDTYQLLFNQNHIIAPYQHLYFLSDEEIKEGDIAVYNGELYHINTHHKGVTYKGKNATSGGGRTEYNYYTVLNMSKRTSSTEIIHYPYSRRFKPVVACSDPSLGLPIIPTTWIRDVYVPSNGSIKEVKLKTYVELYPIIDEGFHGHREYEHLELTPDNEVVIVDIPKEFTEAKEWAEKVNKTLNWSDKESVDQELEDVANSHSEDWVYTEYGNDVRENLSARKEAFREGFKEGAKWKAEQSANDAMSFVEWVHKQHYEIPNSNIPITWTNEGHRWPPNNIYTTQELYELWQQNR